MFLILSHLLAYLYLVFDKELDIYIMSNITQPKQLHHCLPLYQAQVELQSG